MDIFDTKEAKAMLIAKQSEPFDDENYIYELKFDGIRCLAYLDETTDLRNKRNKELLPLFPELQNLHLQVKQKCILDGELIVMKAGKPDFYEVQKRAMMTNLFKIESSCRKYPASYVVYDIVYVQDHELIDEMIEKRKEVLNQIVLENEKIAISKVMEGKGVMLFELVKEQNLEGVVAKRKGSHYFFGKRSQDWIKFKVMDEEDYVICGYIMKAHGMCTFVLGQYTSTNELMYQGHCTLGCNLASLYQHSPIVITSSPFNSIAKGNEETVWIKPEIVGIVEYMPSEKGLRQPVFKGIREDKEPMDCRIRNEKQTCNFSF